jgi:ATP-dependent DNA helicase RecG
MALSDPITGIKGVGAEVAKKFKVLGISQVADLIDYYPRRYEDFSEITQIAQIRPGSITIKGEIKQAKGRYVRRGMHITEAVISDHTGSVRLVWFNQPYREKALKSAVQYYVSGQFGLNHQRLSVMNPSVELVQDFPANTARILAVYRETKGLNSSQIRKIIREVLPDVRTLEETLPHWIISEEKLISRAEALEGMHFPKSSAQIDKAKKRLGFEEVFCLTLASLLNKYELSGEHSLKIPFKKKLAQEFVSHLPFKLTDSQRVVTWDIYKDLEREHPMNRMVEGDVGSGKTVVAAMAALMVSKKGYQTAFMAPTELLARQHAATLHDLMEPLNLGGEVDLLVGSMSTQQKALARAHIKDGSAKLIVGTHALIAEKVDMHKLGLIIIDEQHRFGVDQRKTLMAKAGHMPHVLSLTATPIPRSLALTLYGELDVSILKEKPPNRSSILTKIVSPNSRTSLYQIINKELDEGRQMFVVCPLITDSPMLEANSVERVYEHMSKNDFKNRRVGLLHGKMKAADKNRTMEKFINKELDILVSTTVIEVGVDVPNATIMLIEAAERFGLAQLHQLRGRVGRGEDQGYCYLMLSDSSSPSPRLRALQSSNDGFELAELDLSLRGPGAIYGTSQHGEIDLRVAKLTDVHLIAAARSRAQDFIDKKEKISHYKVLYEYVNRLRAVTNLN